MTDGLKLAHMSFCPLKPFSDLGSFDPLALRVAALREKVEGCRRSMEKAFLKQVVTLFWFVRGFVTQLY